ncbi:MAG: hypothetical protein MUF68_05110 [Cyclobacteriaceae bacterium]|nr:hypothetical protein [Cyclobacteriaceae bacterium]
MQTIKNLSGKLLPSKFYYSSANANELVVNRLEADAPVDGTIRALQFIRADSSKALLVTFSGHPTSISKKSTALSADYPGVIAREMKNDGFAFTMFMAGMVGSHRVRDNGLSDFDLVEKTGQTIAEKLHNTNWILQSDTSALRYANVPLVLGNPQLRVGSHIKLRSWVFNAGLAPLHFVTV